MFKIFKNSFFLLFLLTSCMINRDIHINNKRTLIEDDKKIYKVLGNLNFRGKVTKIKNGDNLFLIYSLSKNIVKISLKNSSIDWIKEISTIPQNNFVFNGDYIYFTGYDNNFYMINYYSGNIENIIFNSSEKTIKLSKKPYIYSDKIVVFFNNNELVIVQNKKVIKDVYYKYSAIIENDKIIIDNNEVIKL